MHRTLQQRSQVRRIMASGSSVETCGWERGHQRTEMILIIAKSIPLSWSTVKAILCARAEGRQAAGGEIAQCLASYERLRSATALEILRFHRMRGRTGAKQPT